MHGAGRAFSAGADIEEIAGFASAADFRRFIHGFTDALVLLEASPLPFVAALNGLAFGGGLELAMACDLRVAAADGKLGLPEAKLGVLPGAGGTQRLPRLVPRGVATEMLMLGRTIDGARAYQLGLVNQLAAAPPGGPGGCGGAGPGAGRRGLARPGAGQVTAAGDGRIRARRRDHPGAGGSYRAVRDAGRAGGLRRVHAAPGAGVRRGPAVGPAAHERPGPAVGPAVMNAADQPWGRPS